MYFTYILINRERNRYYVGSTSNLKSRLQKHKSGKVLSTKSNTNYELEWYCGFKNKQQALLFEKYLKTGSGVAFMKKRFINSETNVLYSKEAGKLATRSSKSEV